jgi:RES domain-containing protein
MPLRVVRIGRTVHPIWDGRGAAIAGGRWNAPGVEVIYAAASRALAMLEVLVQGGDFAAPRAVVVAEIPDTVPVEHIDQPPPGWREVGSASAVAAGMAWHAAGRTAVLSVPSAVVPAERNYLINPRHSDAARIIVHAPEPIEWDPRLFGIVGPG